MSEMTRMWVEVTFNILYLCVIWGLVAAMLRRQPRLDPQNRRIARLFCLAFALLAFGDTGHVGFRVLAYARGGLDQTLSLAGIDIPLVGAGALATAVTVTLFYVLMLEIWRTRYEKQYGVFEYLMLAAAGIRLLVMLSPENQWQLPDPVQPWSTYRNLPLMVLGLGVAYLILRDALPARDHAFTWIGAMILVSYACYMPVVFFVQQLPIIGMLMIPKTLAYLGVAVIGYREFYRQPAHHDAVSSDLPAILPQH